MAKAKEKKTTTRTKRDEQMQVLDLLRAVLPKVAPDPAWADKIYAACEAELRAKNRVVSFEKFCDRIELPNLEPKTVEEVKEHFVAGFVARECRYLPPFCYCFAHYCRAREWRPHAAKRSDQGTLRQIHSTKSS